MSEALLARGVEVCDELPSSVWVGQRFRAHGPHGGKPWEAGVMVPQAGDVMPGAGANAGFNRGALLKSEKCRVADDQSGVVISEHGRNIGGGVNEGGVVLVKAREDEACVGDGAARSGIGCKGAQGGEGMWGFDDELNGADLGE